MMELWEHKNNERECERSGRELFMCLFTPKIESRARRCDESRTGASRSAHTRLAHSQLRGVSRSTFIDKNQITFCCCYCLWVCQPALTYDNRFALELQMRSLTELNKLIILFAWAVGWFKWSIKNNVRSWNVIFL